MGPDLLCSLSVHMCDFDVLPRSLHGAEGGLAQLNTSLPQRNTFTLLMHATALTCSCSRQELGELAEYQTNTFSFFHFATKSSSP